MIVGVRVQLRGTALEHELVLDFCPLCSQIEDHDHAAKIYEFKDDEMDGRPLDTESRKLVLAMVKVDW